MRRASRRVIAGGSSRMSQICSRAFQRQRRQAANAATMSPESTATRTSDKVAIYVQRRGRLNTKSVITLLLVLLVVTLGDPDKRQSRYTRSATRSLKHERGGHFVVASSCRYVGRPSRKESGGSTKARVQATVSLQTFSDEVAKSTAKSPQQQIRDRCSATRSLKIRHFGTVVEMLATESLQVLGGKEGKNCNRNFKPKFRNFKPIIATSNPKFRNYKLKLHK